MKDFIIDKYKLKQIYKENKIILFGASSFGEKILHELQELNINIVYFCDNDVNKHNKYFNGIKIISPNQLYEIREDAIVIITSVYVHCIYKQLIEHNVNNIYYIPEDCEYRELRPTGSTGKNLLIIVNDNMGDNIMRIELIKKLMNFYGEDKILFVTSKGGAYDFLKLITNNVIAINCREKNYFDKTDIINRIGIDKIINLTFLGFHAQNANWIKEIKCNEIMLNQDSNNYDYALCGQVDLVNKITKSKLNIENIKPNLSFLIRDRKEYKFNGKVISIGACSNEKFKMMEVNSLSAVIDYFTKKHPVVLLGKGKEDKEYYRKVFNECNNKNRIINLVDKLSIEQTINVINESKFFFGVDSGLSHIAYGLDKTSIVLMCGFYYNKFHHNAENMNYICLKKDCYRCEKNCKYSNYSEQRSPCLVNIKLKDIANLADIKFS